jgi:Fic family protein
VQEEKMKYIWQLTDWPQFSWDSPKIDKNSYVYAIKASTTLGQVGQIAFKDQQETSLELMISEAVKTSHIEGELVNQEDVRSSLRNQLGLNPQLEPVGDQRAPGIAALMISVQKNFKEPLSSALLCEWHVLLFGRYRHQAHLEVGKWRATPEPMYILSGEMGREKIHYEAPPSVHVPQEMDRFIAWFNGSRDLPAAVRAGLAHLYFECIHPFADGNGRIGRAIAEIALAQELGHPALLSLSTTIHARRKEYYAALAQASKGTLEVSEWLIWFTALVVEAQEQAIAQIEFVLSKSRFWQRHAAQLNPRQEKVLSRILREGLAGFAGGLTAQKYMKIADCSKATATRDLSNLLAMSCLKKSASAGRSTRYEIQL